MFVSLLDILKVEALGSFNVLSSNVYFHNKPHFFNCLSTFANFSFTYVVVPTKFTRHPSIIHGLTTLFTSSHYCCQLVTSHDYLPLKLSLHEVTGSIIVFTK